MPDEPKFPFTRQERAAIVTASLLAASPPPHVWSSSPFRRGASAPRGAPQRAIPSLRPGLGEVVVDDPVFAAEAADQANRMLGAFRARLADAEPGGVLLTDARTFGPVWRADYWTGQERRDRTLNRLIVWRQPRNEALSVVVAVCAPETLPLGAPR